MSERFFHHHGWNVSLFNVSILWVQHPGASQLFSGLSLVAWGPASFIFSGWSLSRHISYCTFTDQKWHQWLTCIHIHSVVLNLCYSTQLSTLIFNHGDVLIPDMDFCETRPEPLIASVILTPSLAEISNTLPSASAALNVYSIGKARRKIVSSVQFELAALAQKMTSEDLRTMAQPFSQYYTTMSPSTSHALVDYMLMRTVFLLACFHKYFSPVF